MAGVATDPFAFSNRAFSSLETFGPISLAEPVAKMGIATSKTWATSWLSGFWSNLHNYFDVTNSYVLNKIMLILLPFSQPQEWRQEVDENGHPGSPRYNLHAPDLYIPLMSYVTFVLLAGVSAGWKGNFAPDYLGMAASSGIVVIMLEMMILYGGFYLLQSAMPTPLDLLAYSGYKFLPCVVNQAVSLLLGAEVYYPVYCFTTGMLGMFMVISM